MKTILTFCLIAACFIFHSSIMAQQEITKYTEGKGKDTTGYKKGWTPRGTIGIGLNQVALENWTRGGENVIAITGTSDFGAIYYGKPWLLKNTLSASVGTTKTGSSSFQTNDNAALLENVLVYKVGWAIDPFAANEVRTGILDGYDYKLDPIVQTSAFFDPGYVTQSVGFTFDRPNFSTRLGVAFQEIFANRFTQYTDDIKTASTKETFKFQTGIESVTDANYIIAKNLLYSGRLRLFSAFNQLDVWDVGFDNTFAAKINDFLAVNLNILMIYEKAQTPKTQLKEGLNIGIAYTVF